MVITGSVSYLFMRMRKCQYLGCTTDAVYRCVKCRRFICGGHRYQPILDSYLTTLQYYQMRNRGRTAITHCGNCWVAYMERVHMEHYASGHPSEKFGPGYYLRHRKKRDLIEW